MNVLERLASAGIVPVVVIENAENAVPTAKAMLKGGIDVMEITFRTAAAADAIKAVAENCPEMLVGAGTVITLEQCKKAVKMGAKFIVSPGFDHDVVEWCVNNGVAVTPGCVTPTEIMMAMKLGIKVVKFFPANVYGGLSAMKSLSGPFGSIKFIPTGGINAQNSGEYISASYIHAVGGSWVCPKADISAGNYDRISFLCKESKQALLGYEIAHIGINANEEKAAREVANVFSELFGFIAKEGKSSIFSSNNIELMKSKYLGNHGHLAVRTNSIEIAIADLEKKGYEVDKNTAKYKGDQMVAIYLKNEVSGFAIHLLQR